MASNAARSTVVPPRPLPLNSEGTLRRDAGATPREDEQLDLSPEIHWLKKGARVRDLLLRAMTVNGVSFAEVERQTNVDEKQAKRALTEGAGANLPSQLVAFLLWSDRAGVVITGLADMLGYEAHPRAPDLAAENRRLKEKLAEVMSLAQGVLGGLR